MALGEDFIDLVNGLLAVAGRTAGPERRFEFGAWHGLAPHPPAGHAPGLARQVIKCALEGLEPAAEAFGIDQAIGRRSGSSHGRGSWPQVVDLGIRREEKDARRMLRVFYPALAQLREIFPRIVELEGREPAPAALSDDCAPWAWDARVPPSPQGPAPQ